MRRHLAQLVLQLAFHGFNGAISVQLVQSLLHSSILFTRGVELRAVCGVRCALLSPCRAATVAPFAVDGEAQLGAHCLRR